MYQHIMVVGHLGDDPTLRYTPSGIPVARFPVAANRRWTDGEGEKQEETTWFRVTTWRGLAETCNQYLKKGRLVVVSGRIRTRTWKNDAGEEQYGWGLIANTVRFADTNRVVSAEGEEPEELEELVDEGQREGIEADIGF